MTTMMPVFPSILLFSASHLTALFSPHIKHWVSAWWPEWKNQACRLLAAANRNSGLGVKVGVRGAGLVPATLPAGSPAHQRAYGNINW